MPVLTDEVVQVLLRQLEHQRWERLEAAVERHLDEEPPADAARFRDELASAHTNGQWLDLVQRKLAEHGVPPDEYVGW